MTGIIIFQRWFRPQNENCKSNVFWIACIFNITSRSSQPAHTRPHTHTNGLQKFELWLTQNTARSELLLQGWFDFGETLTIHILGHNALAAFLAQYRIFGQLGFGFPFAAHWQNVVSLVPLTERCGVDDNDGVLHQGLGAHQFVVRGVEHDIDDTGLAGRSLGGPGKVTMVQAKGTEFWVTTTGADLMNTLLSDLIRLAAAAAARGKKRKTRKSCTRLVTWTMMVWLFRHVEHDRF